MKFGVFVLGISCLFSVSTTLYTSKDEVVTLNSKSFSQVLASPHLWIVEFFAPWCGHCQKLAPEYKKAAKILKNYAKVAAVNCDEDASKAICSTYGIRGFPTIKAFASDRVGEKKFAMDYNGPRTAGGIKSFAIDNISGKNIRILKHGSKSSLEMFYAEKVPFLYTYDIFNLFNHPQNSSVAKVLLFTDKNIPSATFKVLSLEFKDVLLFAQIHKSETYYIQEFEIKKFPTLFVAKIDGSLVKFDGEIAFQTLFRFLKEITGNDKTENSWSVDFEKSKSSDIEEADLNVHVIADALDFHENCVQKTQEGLSSLCLMVFAPPLEEEFEESVSLRKSIIDILKKTKKRLFEISKETPIPKIHVNMLDGVQTSNVIQKFGLSSDLPSAMLVNPSKMLYRPLQKAFDSDSLISFIKETARGIGNVITYTGKIEIISYRDEEATCQSTTETCSKKSAEHLVSSHEEFDYEFGSISEAVGEIKQFIHEPTTIETKENQKIGITTLEKEKIENRENVNAALVILTRNKEMNELVETLKTFELRFNSNHHYPYVFLNEEEFTEEFKIKMKECVSGEAHFGIIDKSKEWSYPSWINQDEAKNKRDEMSRKKVPYGGSESYRFMCRYQSGFFFRHELLKSFDYYWRIEPSTKITCDIDYDPFLVMRDNDFKYGFTIGIHEYMETVESLWPTTLKYAEERRKTDPSFNPSLLKFFSDNDGKSFNGHHFWSNFEIASLNFLRSEEYVSYFDYLDKEGGFFYERWGDAPVHSLGVGLFLKKEEVIFFEDIGYFHNPFHHCPSNAITRKRLRCDCQIENSISHHGFAITSNFLLYKPTPFWQ